MVRELAIPVPFEVSSLGACLEARTGRTAVLKSVVMKPGVPSGVLLRAGCADYLFYEEQASPFHQSHIVLSLAARMLLGDGSSPVIDLLVPDVSPQLVALMLGTAGGRPVTDREAETFAFLALAAGRAVNLPPMLSRRALRRIRPLHSALRNAIPDMASPAATDRRSRATFLLYRQVIEIRDVMLALRPFRDPEAARTAARAGRVAGLTGDELAATVEAAVLFSALRARSSGRDVPNAAGDLAWAPLGGSDLRTEAACLVKVSRAFAGLQSGMKAARARASERGPDGTSSS